MKDKTRKNARNTSKKGGVLVLFAVITLAGWWWLSQSGSRTNPEEGILDVWTTWGDSPEALAALLEGYSQEHDVAVNVSGRVRLDDLHESLNSSEVPDLVVLSAADPIQEFFEMGWVQSLGSQSVADGPGVPALDDLYPDALERCRTAEGMLTCVPMGLDVMALYRNQDLFIQAGLDPSVSPANFEDLIEYARVLTLRDDDGQLLQAGFIPGIPAPQDSLYSASRHMEPAVDVGPSASHTALASQDSGAWLQQIYELYDQNELDEYVDSFTPYASSPHPVFSDRRMSCRQCHRTTDLSGKKIPALGLPTGKVAMMVDGSWELFRATSADSIAIASAPFPASSTDADQNGTTVVDGPVLFIPAHAEDNRAALDLLNWILTPEVQLEAAQTFAMLPANAEVVQNGSFAAPEALRPLIELLATP